MDYALWYSSNGVYKPKDFDIDLAMAMRFFPRTHTYIGDFWDRLKNNYGDTLASSDYRRPGSRSPTYVVLAIWGKRGRPFADFDVPQNYFLVV